MHIKEIRWKKNFPNAGVDAEVAYQVIEEIREESEGVVSPDQLIEKAKKKNCPVHDCFDWDDTHAAHQYRLNQARTLLRSIEVEYKELPDQPVRLYEITYKKKRGDASEKTLYMTTDDAMADPETRDALIAEAIRAAMAYRRRFRGLRELQLIFEAIEKVTEELGSE